MKASPVMKKPKAVRSMKKPKAVRSMKKPRKKASPQGMKASPVMKKPKAVPLALLRANATGGYHRSDRRRRRRDVFNGKDTKTWGGMKQGDLLKNKNGKVVSKKLSKQGQKRCWPMAIAAARVALDLTGFVAIKKGSALYRKARQIYNIMKTPFEEMPLLYRCDFPC